MGRKRMGRVGGVDLSGMLFEERYGLQALRAHILGGTPEILCFGMRGCGKTVAMCWLCHCFAQQYAGMTQIWLRSTRARLTDAVLKTFEQEVLPYSYNPFGRSARETRKIYAYPNGSEIILQGMDDPSRQRSVAADLIWVNEPTELTVDEWEEVGASARKTMGSSCPFRVKLGDINPAPPTHWTNTRCPLFPSELYPRVSDDGTRMAEWYTPEMYADTLAWNLEPLRKPHLTKKIVFTIADNPGYWEVSQDRWGWKEPGLEYARNQLSRLTGSRRARYLEGRPVALEGVVFPEFSDDRHVCDVFGIGDWPVIVAYDAGFDHPAAVIFVCVAPDGQLFVVDEVYGSGMRLDELAAKVKEKVARKRYNVVDWLADPNGCFARRQESSGRTISDQMYYDHGLRFRKWPVAQGAAKTAQVEGVRLALTHYARPLQVFRSCWNIISEFQSWAFKRNTDGSVPQGDDAYEDRNNDAMDCLMGIIATRPSVEKPVARLMRTGPIG